MFGWPHETGAILGAVVIVLYCFTGGIRASIWTDTVQSIVMLISMLLLSVVSLEQLGGFEALWSQLAAIDPKLVQIIPEKQFGFTPFLLGWFGAGLGVVGQPHVMIRAMAIRDPEEIKKARTIYFGWYWMFSAGCILVAMTCRALLDIPSIENFDQELALPQLALQLLPGVLVGVVLGGCFRRRCPPRILRSSPARLRSLTTSSRARRATTIP